MSRDEAIAHAAALAGGVDVPVSADLENGFGAAPDAVFADGQPPPPPVWPAARSRTFPAIRMRRSTPLELAVERVAAAAQAAHSADAGLVLTARAENLIHGIHDLADTIARLQAFQNAGADVLYAPGLSRLEDVRTVTASVDLPVNVLARPGLGSVAELAGRIRRPDLRRRRFRLRRLRRTVPRRDGTARPRQLRLPGRRRPGARAIGRGVRASVIPTDKR